METKGIHPDGSLDHSYPPSYALVPLGHYSWKWSDTRKRYNTYERELLAGILAMSTQFRMLSHQKIVWFCDNQATRSFLDSAPPMNPRLRRWYTFLSQFNLCIKHISGLKNEFCDWLSRGKFEAMIGENFDEVAAEAFERMDLQLDFAILFKLTTPLNFSEKDYLESELKPIWEMIEERKSTLIDGKMFYKTDRELFHETKRMVMSSKLEKVLQWCHDVNGHPGAQRTVLFFSKHFYSEVLKKELMLIAKKICDQCEVCLKSKPNTASDRGIISSLPIPQIANDTIYIDFISMDSHNEFNYVLTMVDSLTKFSKFIPCTKNISGEETLKMVFREWIMHYDKPVCIMSDNDVRFSQHEGFYQKVFRSFGIDVKFAIPRHPQSNGLCERTNRSFIQNLRALSLEMKTMDWPKLTPIVSWLMNSQVNPKTLCTPSELFLGRPTWRGEIVPENDTSPNVEDFLQFQMEAQEAVSKRLQQLRNVSNKNLNRGRTKTTNFYVGDYVLVSRERWPQRKLKKLESQWLGPYKIVEVRHNSLKVAVSPSMGGYAIVSFSQVKHWRSIIDHDGEVEENDGFDPDNEVEMDDDEPRNPEEKEKDLPPGYFLVSKILKHKFDQGWKFLTAWENFPISSATWEPPKNFQLEGGRWNDIFEDYCRSNGIPFPPGRKRILVCRSEENFGAFPTPGRNRILVSRSNANCSGLATPQERVFSEQEGRARPQEPECNGKSLESSEGLACQGESKREARHQTLSERASSWSGSGQPLTPQP
jgi:hypothetical protein